MLALALGISGLPSPLYPLYQEHWHLSPLTITVVFAGYAIGALVSALTVGPISDAVGRKPVLYVALTTVLVGLAVFLIADHAWQLVLARLLHGVAVGALTVVAGAALLDLRPHDGARNGMAGGVALNTGMAVTVLAVAVAAQWAKDPLQLPYMIFAVITAAMLVILVLLSEPHVEHTGGRLRIAAPTVPRGIRSDFWFAAMGIMTAWSVLGVFMSLFPRLTQEATGHPSIVFVGVVISVMAAASAIAQWASGRGDPQTTAIIGDLGMAVSLLFAIWALHSARSSRTSSAPSPSAASPRPGWGSGAHRTRPWSSPTSSPEPGAPPERNRPRTFRCGAGPSDLLRRQCANWCVVASSRGIGPSSFCKKATSSLMSPSSLVARSWLSPLRTTMRWTVRSARSSGIG